MLNIYVQLNISFLEKTVYYFRIDGCTNRAQRRQLGDGGELVFRLPITTAN
jgi:hypothetical protein